MANVVNDWYLGLDVGTNSVGWCASDAEYSILTKSGRLQCGARLFTDAQDATERRTFRSIRRRFARRKVRVDLLQGLFNEAIAEKDQAFFIRMNESYKQNENGRGLYPLFTDSDFTDRDYYAKFPTIHHLRKHLMENDETDVRLLYLACHHLVKYRGHFLFESFNTDGGSGDYAEILAKFGDNVTFETLNANKGVAAALKGNKIDLAKIFADDTEIKEKLAPIKDQLTADYNFKSEKFEELQEIAGGILGDDQIGHIRALKSLYDRIQLDRILNGAKNVSAAMVIRYDEHKADLRALKNFIKEYLPSEYGGVFRANGIYANYIGLNNTHNQETVSHDSKCQTDITTITYEDFIGKLYCEKEQKDKPTGCTGILASQRDNENCKNFIEKIKNGTFLKLHNIKDNAYIPHQLNEAELRRILEKQKSNFPFLANADEYGAVAEKIVSLLTFRIPYYVGPLSDCYNGEKFAWVKKLQGQERVRALPWNFDKVVDAAASGEQFITRVTAKCTYLKSEDVIPKASLLYQRYMLFNDLNNLKINGDRISQELKMFLYSGICQTEKSLTKAKIKKYLVDNGKIQKTNEVGKENENDTAFNSSLSSLIKFREILGDSLDEEMCENIVKWHTVFGDEKKPVVAKIKAMYGGKLGEEQIAKLGKLSFKGWAKFSAKFLNGITATDKTTGETALTIINRLENTTLNLMELLNSDNYAPTFLEAVAKENTGDKPALDYDGLVADLYCSPIVKRSIWQAILICKELAKINGSAPKKVFIEVTRGEDKRKKGKMTVSRFSQVKSLLEKAQKDSQAVAALLTELNGKAEQELRSDKLYLYFTQLGKCMYSGEPIDLAQLNNENLYDIDHIYPQSKIKDDSLTNRVLVTRLANAVKTDKYPLADAIRSKMKSYWSMLQNRGLISAEKLRRLTCAQSFTEDQINGFINRQLVSTNQAVKETANALAALFGENTPIVYSKAGNVSEFRHIYDLTKCREVNNLHHAHDAYLNIVVGNVWDSVLSGRRFWRETGRNEDARLDKLFQYDLAGIWKTAYIQKIKDYLFDNKKYLGKYPVTFRPYIKKGAFYDQTIHPKGKAQFELREGQSTAQYGGYKNGTNAYNCVIEFDGKKKERVRGVFPAPVRYAARYDEDALYKKIAEDNQLVNPKVVVKRIMVDSVLEVNGFRFLARTGDLQCPATVEWMPDKEIIQIIHDMVKYRKLVAEKQLKPDTTTIEDIKFASREKNKHQKEGKVISRENNLKVYDAVMSQLSKPFFANYAFAKKVKDGKISREMFAALPTYAQTEQLIAILNAITFNGKEFNAEKIGGVAHEKSIYKINSVAALEVYMITQSVTGLFESKVVINNKAESPDKTVRGS